MIAKTINGTFASMIPPNKKMHDGKSDNDIAFAKCDFFQNIAQQTK